MAAHRPVLGYIPHKPSRPWYSFPGPQGGVIQNQARATSHHSSHLSSPNSHPGQVRAQAPALLPGGAGPSHKPLTIHIVLHLLDFPAETNTRHSHPTSTSHPDDSPLSALQTSAWFVLFPKVTGFHALTLPWERSNTTVEGRFGIFRFLMRKNQDYTENKLCRSNNRVTQNQLPTEAALSCNLAIRPVRRWTLTRESSLLKVKLNQAAQDGWPSWSTAPGAPAFLLRKGTQC